MAKRNVTHEFKTDTVISYNLFNISNIDFISPSAIQFDNYGNIVLKPGGAVWHIGQSLTNPAIGIDNSTQNVGVKTRYPKFPLHVIGDIYCTGKIITDGGIQDNSQSPISQQNMGGGYSTES